MIKIFKHWREILVLTAFSLAFFVPRYFAHLQYDAMEDEILSIDFNQSYSVAQLIKCPDPAHPMIWYLLMEAPTDLLGIDHGIFYYRLIQVILLFFSIVFAYFFCRKNNFLFFITFLALLLSNVLIVHLSFQHRMYALTLSMSIIYSLGWFFLIKSDSQIKLAHVLALSLLAVLLFFTSYSSVWLIPIWPTAYFLYKKNSSSFKNILTFFTIFLLSISWFLPTFFENISKTMVGNQWAPDVNLFNFLDLFANYFGLLIVMSPEKTLNPLTMPLLIILFFISCYLIFYSKYKHFSRPLLFSTFIFLFLFVLFSKITGNRLFYSRTSLTILIPIYILISEFFTERTKFTSLVFALLIAIQVSQFLFYFFLIDTKRIYSVFNYPNHPMSFFESYSFPSGSCLLPIPNWNYLSVEYYLGDVVKVIDVNYFIENNEQFNGCEEVFLLDQSSVDRKVVEQDFSRISEMGYENIFKEENENQALYLLKK